ncbi:F0F1 ATP synthase subunit B [Candidatus Cardinium hertigii]|jgi:F-type H+-transporting ATPase subunit b|uniref:ATP synthase subunit b n=1 Tax=Candidatus Cardinium hertigii TaxID=247481 RepID=A0A3N2QBQ1_9BACT|nr:F0F1 ATP synthase subunit B [Candidatus Cardinium hertigii]ROT47215.1 ATP synthase F0 subunit B [Candidatus Cardinium hertigii]
MEISIITPDFGIIFWQTITFLTVLLVLSTFAWKPIISVLKEREYTIANAINQIAEAQALMEQATGDRAKLLGEAHTERDRIIGAALEAQRAIITRARHEALAVKENLLTQARMEMAKEEERAIETLKSSLGLLAIQAAEKVLMKELSGDQSQLEFIERLTTRCNHSV